MILSILIPTTTDQKVSDAEMTGEGYIKLSAGKKKHALVKIK